MSCYTITAQTNTIEIDAKLDNEKDLIHINQKIIFYNNSSDTLNTIFLHNWPNSYKDKNTPLGRRLIEDYKKEFYFSEVKEKGFTKIHEIAVNNKKATFQEKDDHPDIIQISLNEVQCNLI